MAVSTFIQLDKKFKSTERFLVKWIIYLTGAHCFQFFKIHFVLSLQSFLFKLYTVQGLYYGLFSSSASFFLSFPLPRAWHYMHDSGTHFWKQYYRSVIFRRVFQKLDQSERHVTIALCGYPIAKMEIKDSSQISTTAPIFLYYNYFRQNIWVNILVHFHFQYIFVDLTTNNIRFNSRPCSRCWCYPSLSPIKEKFHKCPTHLVIPVALYPHAEGLGDELNAE